MDNTVEQQNDSAQPNDLFGYIAAQQFEASEDEQLVELAASEAPVDQAAEGEAEDAGEVAATPEATPGVTTPPQAPTGDEADRLRQQVAALEAQQQRQLAAFALLAGKAREREDALFEQSLKLMSDDEAAQARADRERDRIQSENVVLRTQLDGIQRQQSAAAEEIDKASVAHTLLQRLGLPQDDQFVMAALMSAQTPAEMVAAATRLQAVNQRVQQSVAQATAQQAQKTGVHRAGGETAPAAPPKKVPLRSGDLIDMMRERQYAVE